MELEDAIRNRRSIREYLKKPVEKEKIEKIIKFATWAPSACNNQGWKFVVVEDEKRKKYLAERGVVHLKDAPVGIFVLYDNRTNNLEYRDYIQSAAAAIQNMHLIAHSLGLGSCWVAHLPSKGRLRKLLDIPWYYDPIALVTIGYYKKHPKAPVRKYNSLTDVLCYNKFNFDEEYTPKSSYLLAKFLVKMYKKLPTIIKLKIKGNRLVKKIKDNLNIQETEEWHKTESS
jgi:nitroreductase